MASPDISPGTTTDDAGRRAAKVPDDPARRIVLQVASVDDYFIASNRHRDFPRHAAADGYGFQVCKAGH